MAQCEKIAFPFTQCVSFCSLVHSLYKFELVFMSPHYGGWGHIVFSADPRGGSGVASCPHSISLLNGHILTKLTQIYHWEGEKC